MSNKFLGEVDIKLGKTDAKVVFDLRAISNFQSDFGTDADINTFRIDALVDTLLIGLKKHNPEITKDDIYDASPSVTALSDCIVEGFVYAQHGPEKGRELVDQARKITDDLEKKALPAS